MHESRPPSGFQALLADRRGVVGLYFAVVMSAMALLSVAALDLIRVHLVRSRMAMAVDSAILAAGRSLGTDNWQQVGVAYYNANRETSLASIPAITANDIQATNLGLGLDQVSLTIRSTVPLWSAGLGNLSSLDLTVSAVARRRTVSMELAMVLDNTGSMLTNDNIGALRADAIQLLDILANYQQTGRMPNVSVAVVPYSGAVNVGAVASSLSLVTPTTYDPGNVLGWKGCVIEAPAEGGKLMNKPAGKFRAYVAPNAVDNDYTPGKASTVRADWTYGNGSTGPNVGCPTPIQPLTQDIGTIRTALSDMRAWSRGGTLSDIGMAWGYRVLSPEAPFTQGSAWNTPNLTKAVVMMTDGAAGYHKLTSNAGVNEENKSVKSDYAGYGRVDEYSLLGVSTKDEATGKINERLAALCTTMKSAGNNIQVFTITFGGLDATTRGIYQTCASSPNNYYDAPDQYALENAFRAIGAQLTELILVK